jgi:hypothetical protein
MTLSLSRFLSILSTHALLPWLAIVLEVKSVFT